MNFNRPLIKACLLADDEAIVVKAFCVGPGSVNDHPPTDTQVSSPLYLFFRAVKRLYKEAELESMGAI